IQTLIFNQRCAFVQRLQQS
ncbi:unnamed protein product, partial [Allacma fusca]